MGQIAATQDATHLPIANEANVLTPKKRQPATAPAAATSRAGQAAQQHTANLQTRLALMRWTKGGDVPHVIPLHQALPQRANWYDNLQQEFQAWLGAGGFHRLEPAAHEEGLLEPVAHTPETAGVVEPK